MKTSRPSPRAIALAQILIAVSLVPIAQQAHASEALSKRYACTACHQAEKKLVGPPWRDIATKYGGGSVTAEQLADAIKKGGAGKWGSVPMPAQPHVNPADLVVMSNWILEGGKP